MSSDIAIYNASVDERLRYAENLAKASLLPDDYKRQPANVLLALESGYALNVAPMVAIQEIHVIKGKPSPSAQLQAALVRRAGHKLRVGGDAKHAWCEIVRADDPEFTFRTDWDLDRARAAGLLSNQMWTKYPANMLKARAISECARDACPDVIVGFGYTPEELGDETDDAGATTTTVHRASATPAAPVDGDAHIEDAVVVEDSPEWVPFIASATSRDELRGVWDRFAADLPDAFARSRLSQAMTDRADEIDREATDSGDGAGEAGAETEVRSDDAPEAPSPDTTTDDAAPATRTDLTRLSIRLGELGIKDRQDALDYISAAIGRVITTRNEMNRAEAAKAIAKAAYDLGEDVAAPAGAA